MRTIGYCDAIDSELSIRQLDLTPNDSEFSLHLSPNARPKYSKESIDSGCQQEAVVDDAHRTDNCDNEHRIAVEITCHDPTNRNCHRNHQRHELTVHASSSSTLSDMSCSNRTVESDASRMKEAKKYHSAKRRLRTESLIGRSRSFQEQDVKPSIRNSRFFIRRHDPPERPVDRNVANDETISHHNIEITVEDMDPDANEMTQPRRPLRNRKPFIVDSTSLDSYEMKYERTKLRSGHIFGRLFRRMRKISVGWRMPGCKMRNRGENNCSIKCFRIKNPRFTSLTTLTCQLVRHSY